LLGTETRLVVRTQTPEEGREQRDVLHPGLGRECPRCRERLGRSAAPHQHPAVVQQRARVLGRPTTRSATLTQIAGTCFDNGLSNFAQVMRQA
jgi:hypothetical protein